MRLHRFYITSDCSTKDIVVQDRDLIHQWKKVFRYNIGSQVIVFDGSGVDVRAVIMSMDHSKATLSAVESKEIPPPSKNIWLCLSLIKKDNFEFALQKAVELGVTHIVPIVTERSEKKKLNIERMKKIVIEATEQSGRGDIAHVGEPTTLSALFESGALPQEKIFFDPMFPPVRTYIQNNPQYSFALCIGPEGGFSETDIELFKKYNVSGWSLGQTVLRAETAAIVASALFLI